MTGPKEKYQDSFTCVRALILAVEDLDVARAKVKEHADRCEVFAKEWRAEGRHDMAERETEIVNLLRQLLEMTS